MNMNVSLLKNYKIMTLSFDKKNKWNLIITTSDNKKHNISIPPTDGNRIDIITNDKILNGYNLNIDAVIITIKKGTPTVSYIKDNQLTQIRKK